jgi:hypothetical protein
MPQNTRFTRRFNFSYSEGITFILWTFFTCFVERACRPISTHIGSNEALCTIQDSKEDLHLLNHPNIENILMPLQCTQLVCLRQKLSAYWNSSVEVTPVLWCFWFTASAFVRYSSGCWTTFESDRWFITLRIAFVH